MSLPLRNNVDTIRRPPNTCVSLETTINKGGRTSIKSQFFDVSPQTIFGSCAMKMNSLLLSTRDGYPSEPTSISMALEFSDYESGSLTSIIKFGEGSGTVDERSECFSSATIISELFYSY